MGDKLASIAAATGSPFSPDELIVGDLDQVLTKKVTLLLGENRTRGALLGRVAGAVSTAAFAGNTGDGVFAALPTVAAGVKEGDYKLVIIEPAANAGKFVLYDPDGLVVGTGTVAVAFNSQLAFTLNDGAADFVAGDGFTITVAVGTKYKLAVAAATDGSHKPLVILADDRDATAADKECMVFVKGRFNPLAMTFGAGVTAANAAAGLSALGIDLIASQPD